MSMFDCLKHGGIAIAGPTGSGKTSVLLGSKYILDVCIADTGSLAHKMHHIGGGEVIVIDHSKKDYSPINQVRDFVARCEHDGRLWILDSWSALESQQCAWLKPKCKNQSLSQFDHKDVVGWMRDLAFVLSQGHGVTLFNTSLGGSIKNDDGTVTIVPQGAITGYPSLSGVTPGSESILARWSSVYVAFRGWTKRNDNGDVIAHYPRGFLLEGHDIRTREAQQLTPRKDHYRALAPGEIPVGDTSAPTTTHPFQAEDSNVCTFDAILERIAARWVAPKPKTRTKRVSVEGHVSPAEPESGAA